MSTRMAQGKDETTPPDRSRSSSAVRKNERAFPDEQTVQRTKHTVEQLVKENEQLAHELESRTQENRLLNEVISTVRTTRKLDEVLSHVVDTITRAATCHAAFIYLYDQEKTQIVLASTSEPYQHQIGKISMALGEGIAGWVGMHRQPAIIREGALNDPRFRAYPELEEEKFQSLMSVPILSKERQLIGVITVHTIAPYEFTEQHHTFAMNTAASLVA